MRDTPDDSDVSSPWAAIAVLKVRARGEDQRGRDGHGRFIDLRVGEVVHRLRWIPPGRFLMGSPESEPGRWNDEGPQHEVTVTEGFWLGETPVTQGLWVAIMGKHPSRFRDPARPVEKVSWEDTQVFFDRLDAMLGFTAGLPTEAQWEHACRAGTTTGTWLGDLEILGEYNAPLLDDVAWYGGNSGHQFDLGNGADTARWPNKKHDHRRAGTRAVATKAANPWGLHDMPSNVWEWCHDFAGAYTETPATDPQGPAHGEHCIIRGGAWSYEARDARAAGRAWNLPSHSRIHLGFRLARAEPRQSGGSGGEAEPRRQPDAEPTLRLPAERARRGQVATAIFRPPPRRLPHRSSQATSAPRRGPHPLRPRWHPEQAASSRRRRRCP